ncbi:Lipoprotein OS=Tsukamurella paurometabola (strain ATCC 8368 / DSM / CCUG 35730 / CIP 100753/ JCM 10117 / KCTC 9821 / NBRC 16120 / NCIMB 702349 / NCTC 13040)OX=521096 GN=Tpau_2629 PE=4 SV=1 [Tsukamurella paurometabola]|uniref:Uncharacterized protein n=1 Tax=Tsukamurella paurometabola (strain ATCC 8368 / DSM 20162 / CCUG 35730 / CIP 100753 / JCM 10117 / KCTC 9821 / NBRC 16120 / NCIMB 702349 / NCTC 13040) TaxID=521096 RepID=D5USF9_TSUPD|nr:conserved hypothetical protein [Tsukamurella paurometabola DSM 20162]SUP34663.1 Uncharacterised protein [Tsukamurella paurometabola]
MVAALGAVAVASAACGSSDGGAGPSSAAPEATSHAAPAPSAGCAAAAPAMPANAATIDVPQAAITLEQAGEGAQRTVALRPTATAATSLFTNSLQVSMVSGEQPSGGNRDVTLPFTSQPTCADPLDVVLYFGAPTSTDAALTKALAGQQGHIARVKLTAGGEVRSFTIAAPPGISTEAQATFEQALLQTFLRMIPLPAEPVGTGATWTSIRKIRADSDLTQTMKVTLGGTVESPVLTAVVDEEPDGDVFRVPGSSTTLTIESYTMAGKGSATIDPARAFPVDGGVQLEGGRTLVGDDPSRKLTQKTGAISRWTPA